MTRTNFRVFLCCFLMTLVLWPLGCSFLPSGDGESGLLSVVPETTGSARVKFQVVDPDQSARAANLTDVPAGAIRASGAEVRVTIRLVLVDSGAAANRVTTLVKTVTPINGTAEASFQGVPARSVVGEIIVENGSIGGKSHFHGAADLTAGDNVLEVSPKGCGHRSDITANVVMAIVQMPEILSLPLPNLVSRIETAGAAAIAMPTVDAYAVVLNDFVTTQVVSETVGRVTIDRTAKKVNCSGAGSWSKEADQVWQGTSEAAAGLAPERVLRQGLGGYCYVAWQNVAKTRSAITRHKVSDGAVEASLILDGLFQQAMVLENGHLILGGTQNGLPLILRWNGTTAGPLTADGIAGFSASWARQFPGLTVNQAVPEAGVEYLEIESGTTLSILCVVRDPQTRLTRHYRVGLDGTTPEALAQTTTFGTWARAGNSEVTIGWDAVSATGVTYNLYWALTSDLAPASHTGKVTGATLPYVHSGLTNGQTYHYLVTWVDADQVEHAQFAKTSAKPVAPVVPQGFSKIAAGFTWSIVAKSDGTAWGCGSFDNSGVTGVGTGAMILRLLQTARVSDILAVSTSKHYSGAHSLFLQRDGTVWSVGRNSAGQLGLGHLTETFVPEKVTGLPAIVAVAAGKDFSLALTRDGAVWGWGAGGNFQSPGTSSPSQIVGLQDIVAIAAGANHGLALQRDGTVWGWGSNSSGNFGITDTADQQVPVRIPGLANIVALEAGYFCSVFVRSDSKVLACGHNPGGLLGLPASDSLILSEIPNLTGVSTVSLSAKKFLAVKADGTVWEGRSGAVGQVTGLPAGIVAVAAGHYHSLALAQDGTIWAWGQGEYGQLGNGTNAYGPLAPAQMVFQAPTVPPAPTQFSVRSLTARNVLTWNSISGTFYRVYFSTTGAPTKNSPFVDAPMSPFTHTGLPDGTTYSYAVSRIDAGGESELSQVVSGTPGPHRSIVDGNWWDGTTWSCGVAPTPLDDTIVEHRVTIGPWYANARAKTVTIEPSGTIYGNGWDPLTVQGKVLNKGSIQQSEYAMCCIVTYGDFDNQGSAMLRSLTFAGPGDHVLSHGADASPFRFTVYGEAATTTIKAGTDLKFACVYDNTDYYGVVSFPASELATGTLDMDGHVLQISGRATAIGLRVDNGIIKNLGGFLGQDDAQVSIPLIENPTTPLRISSKVILARGTVCKVMGNVVVGDGGTLSAQGGAPGTADIRGNLTVEQGGIVTREDQSSLILDLSGNLAVSGTYHANSTRFTGLGTQTIVLSSGNKLDGSWTDLVPTHGIQAGSELRFENAFLDLCPEGTIGTGTLDMAGYALHLQGGTWNPIGSTEGFGVTRGQIVGVTSINVPSLEAHNENHTRFSNVTFVAADPVVGITMNGAFILRDTITMHGNVTISEGSSLCSYPTLLLKVFGNFSGHVYLADFFSSSLQVQASGFGSITLPVP